MVARQSPLVFASRSWRSTFILMVPFLVPGSWAWSSLTVPGPTSP